MLRLAIQASDLQTLPVWSGSRWIFGQSWIEPLQHPALEFLTATGSHEVLLVARETLSGSGAGDPTISDRGFCEAVDDEKLNPLWREIQTWPLDWTAVRLRRNEVAISSGGLGVAPVYLAEAGDSIRGAWDPIELYSYLPSSPLDLERTAHYLVTFAQPYSRRTVFSTLLRVTARSNAEWKPDRKNGARLRVEYPPAVAQPAPRALRDGADPVSAFRRILQESLSRRLSTSLRVCAHLSGGLDSGVVAAAAARVSRDIVHTYGLIMPGANGNDQEERRKELSTLFCFCDHGFEAVLFTPFKVDEPRMRNQRVVPWEEIYDEAFEHLTAAAAMRAGALLLMGTGGDELSYLHWDEMTDAEQAAERKQAVPRREELPCFLTDQAYEAFHDTVLTLDRAPTSIIPSSALDDASCGAPPCLRRGLWPIHPLATPEVVGFCRALPRVWREDRRLFREVLGTFGCSRKVTHPMTTESFGDVLAKALRRDARPTLECVFSRSALADLGLVRQDRLISAYAAYCAGHGDRGAPFYAVAVLELALQAHRDRIAHDPLLLTG